MNIDPYKQLGFLQARKGLFERISRLPFLFYEEQITCDVSAGACDVDGKPSDLLPDEAWGWRLRLGFSERLTDDHHLTFIVTKADDGAILIKILSDMIEKREIRSGISAREVDAAFSEVKNVALGVLEGFKNGWLGKGGSN